VKSRPYESPNRKAQAEETQRRILLALVDLLVEERPGTVSIPQVARRAGVSVRIVYHYFPTKEALFERLTESMDDLVTVPEEGRPALAHSPAELAEALPSQYRFLEANRRAFLALTVSEFGDQVAQQRRESRTVRTDAALEPLSDKLDDEEMRRLRGIVGLLSSFDGFEALTKAWGLTTEEAAETASWAILTLCNRARRSGVAT
jgi:AcrR family transcriptional regulator